MESDNVNNSILKWTEAEVTKWVNGKKIGVFVTKTVVGFNGVQLNELFLILIHAPEVFYNLFKDDTVNALLFVKFSADLKKLFSK
jgi:hypothetical protein